jgi:hypothetical protein
MSTVLSLPVQLVFPAVSNLTLGPVTKRGYSLANTVHGVVLLPKQPSLGQFTSVIFL